MLENTCFQIFYIVAALLFGLAIFRIAPLFFRLLVALARGAVKWPGPRIHDPNPSASRVREQLGTGYQNLFPSFVWNSLTVMASFIFFLLAFISSTPRMRGYIQAKSPLTLIFLEVFALVGGLFALFRVFNNVIQLNALLTDLADRVEPRAIDGQSAESEYSIEHPLIGRYPQGSNSRRALDLYYESVKCHQDGNELRALNLYQEALGFDPSLHEHAREKLSEFSQNSSLQEAGPVNYWLGVHSEYLGDRVQAKVSYEKAIQAFSQQGYPKREARAHCNLGNVKMNLRDESAMDEFEKAIAFNPKNGTAHLNIARIYYGISGPGDPRYERALDAFADAIIADPLLYGTQVISSLREIGYTWEEDLEKITQRVERKRAMD